MSKHAASPQHVVIAGASGLIGRALIHELEAHGHRVTLLVRKPPKNASEVRWDPSQRELDPRALDGADAVVNLAGSRLGRLPWTYDVKKDILRSRVNATLAITAAMAKAARPPSVLLSASSIAAYGDRPGESLTEASTVTVEEGFLPRVVDRWERAAATAPAGTRVVLLRSGMVLGRGGVLSVLRMLGSLGLLAQLGTGQQYWPWISLRDEVRAIVHLLGTDISGPVNLVGPEPATANEILGYLAGELKRPFVIRTPSILVGFTLQDAGRELFLSDQRAEPRVLLDSGFTFRDRTAQQAVDVALKTPEEPPADD